MEIKKEILINQPIHEVWEVLGNQFTTAYKWARGLTHSEGSGKPKLDGAPCSNRTCEVPGFGTIQEDIKKFDSNNYVLAYEVVKGFPGFITTAVNTWTLERRGSNTLVCMHLKMQTKGFKGAIMGPMMKMQLNKTVSGVLEDLKIFVETGSPSDYKQKEVAKSRKKVA
ncbi:SRPBCC family protein [Gilvibacter sp.]|uniref:SRPBCC family protein n=1 Tax=Gilvibacter sp. TaxID=2729997 RepID=UPI003F4A8298